LRGFKVDALENGMPPGRINLLRDSPTLGPKEQQLPLLPVLKAQAAGKDKK